MPAIVSDDLWRRAQSRSVEARSAAGRHPVRGREPRYLLVGLAVCGHCGGPVGSWRTTYGNGDRRRVVPSYRCLWHNDRGATVCGATFIRPQESCDLAVLGAVSAALDPDDIAAGVRAARAELQRQADAPDTRRADLEAVARDASARVERLTAALEYGAGDVAVVVERLKAAQSDLAAARRSLAALTAPSPVVDLAAERRLVAVASEVRANLTTGYELARVCPSTARA